MVSTAGQTGWLAIAALVLASSACESNASGPADGASPQDDAGSDAADASDAHKGAQPDSVDACVEDRDGEVCTLCGGNWYCPGNPPFIPCPDDLSGACTDLGKSCFTCEYEGNGSTACYCGVNDDGGTNDANAVAGWACTPAEFACAQ